VPNPDIGGREKILRVHTRNVPLAQGVDLKVIARGTPGFSGADLANLVNEAALLAARRGKRVVTAAEFEDAKDRVMMGAERRSMAMTEEEKRATAVHESGHALVNVFVKGNDPLHKVTIIPRGRALGVTWSLPEADKLSYSKEWCDAKIAMSFGGRVAEQLVYGEEHINTGASNDIMQATNIARRMVTEWGMSDVLGPLRYAANEQEVFLGHSVTQRQNMSGETAKLVDQEVRRIVTDGEKVARQVLTEHKADLLLLADTLVEYETLSGDEVMAVLRGEKLSRPIDAPVPPSAPTPALPITDEDPTPAPHPGGWGGAAPQGA
jgi:cell division protease FtsH